MFGGLCRTVWCGVSSGNRIREALRIVNCPFLSLSLFSFLVFLNGVWFYLLFLVFPFLGCLSIVLWFLDVFAFLVNFLCTGLCFFNILSSYLSKKKEKDFLHCTCSFLVWTDFYYFALLHIMKACKNVLGYIQKLPNFLLMKLIN